MAEFWYRLTRLPDLTLNKYASLEGRGVNGVIEKHVAFLRQLNRQGIVFNVSYHLFYFYVVPADKSKDTPGHRLQIYLLIRGNDEAAENISALIKSSPLSDFFILEDRLKHSRSSDFSCSIKNVFAERELEMPEFNICAFLTKTETFLPTEADESEDYFMLREWEMNEDGRLYNMCKMMKELNQTVLYRVDLYPVERSVSVREALRKPMSILRKRQEDRNGYQKRDYDGKDVLDSYEDLIEKLDSSPHFIANICVFAGDREDAVSVLDAAGSESLLTGKYKISTFRSDFHPLSFLDDEPVRLENVRDEMVAMRSRPGLIVCRDNTARLNLNYLPTLFTLEEISPFFRFPALYDGEVIQIAKETAPSAIDQKGALFLGKDTNNYDVYFPLSLLPKHAFVSGVPGSGKTNTMHHITSSLWKEYGIPFLVLEPAKQEYRALANDPDMKDMYLFSPNADMSFPLHINPFEMPKGTLVAEHIRRLCEVFEGAFPLDPPMPFLLDTAIEAVYRELGWIPEHLYTGNETIEGTDKKRPLPTMSMLYKRLEKELDSTDYSSEVRGNLESALKVRIGSLLRREMGDVFDVPSSTFSPEKWLEVPAVIELESMGTGPANFLTLMLCSLIRATLKVDPKRENSPLSGTLENGVYTLNAEKGTFFEENDTFSINADIILNLKKDDSFSVRSKSGKTTLTFYGNGQVLLGVKNSLIKGYSEMDEDRRILSVFPGNKDVRHVIFIEEAHNLIGPESVPKTGMEADPKQAATAFVVKMLAEVRALKEGIFIADQLPSIMAQEVLKNTGLKIGLRITSSDDRALLGSTMAASPMQLEQMSTFGQGEALIFYEKLMRPFIMRIKKWWDIEDDEKRELMVTSKNDKDLRLALSDSDTYRDENERSIRIIRDKYANMLTELLNSEEYTISIKLLRSLAEQNKFLKRMIDYLRRVELGEITISDEEKKQKYDELDMVAKKIEKFVSDKEEAILACEDIADTIYDMVLSLERLKNGRWARCNAPEKLMMQITVMQLKMCDDIRATYKELQNAATKLVDYKQLGIKTDRTVELYKKLQSTVVSYLNEHGNDALKKD